MQAVNVVGPVGGIGAFAMVLALSTPATAAAGGFDGPTYQAREREGDGARVLGEFGLGLLGGMVGVGLGAAGYVSAFGGGDPTSAEVLGVAGLVSTPFLIAGGVTLGGEIGGGRGHYGWALLGTFSGAAAGAPLFAFALDRELAGGGSGELVAATSVVMGLFAVVGGVAFYELFADDVRPGERSASRIRWTPVSSLHRDGFSVGLAGRF